MAQQLDDIRGMLRAMQQDMLEFRGRLERIETRVIASDSNAIARVLNSILTRPDDTLHPLRALATNENIPDFPRTREDIDSMNADTLETMLRALDQPLGGELLEKRRRLKHAIGIVLESL
ncbi:hypothetical protein MAPG_10627 [Magnaporthiopsis poae ATCC 64411]|uniref:BAG domain-containing protein n=1 Tax=Magnaporthiopsis poae (strain ATCC 64411 / 73-15) TaxID=644358 RepID=A0A0C4ED34_MAGP6|nr:hypothetical protein MAPG_10627 [Magnaporthiopsis poae ATCC 64411]